jgi:hypothetical protein
MVTIQSIEHDGHVVALIAGGRALIGDELAGSTLALVRAKCLYALEVQAGERPGPYSDEAATRYARSRSRSRTVTSRARAPGSAADPARPGWRTAPGCGPAPSRTASTLTRAVGEGTGPAPVASMSSDSRPGTCWVARSRAALCSCSIGPCRGCGAATSTVTCNPRRPRATHPGQAFEAPPSLREQSFRPALLLLVQRERLAGVGKDRRFHGEGGVCAESA